MFKITPMIVAYGPGREKSRFTYMHNAGGKVDVPYATWLIQDGNMNVLVDAGCSADDYKNHIRSKDGPLVLGGEVFDDVIDIKPLGEHLKERGLAYDDIDIFVQTHLDWDHCMGTRHFKKSKILLQQREWAKVPFHPMFKSTYAPKYVYEEIGKQNLQLIDGDYKIAPGLELVVTPGHSPAGQSVVVDTAAGRYVIAGMCTIRDNFYPPEAVRKNGHQVIVTGMHVDPIECYNSMQKLLEIGGENVIPFHDNANFTRGPIG